VAVTDERPREDHYVQSLQRGLSVITVFGPQTPEMTLVDLGHMGFPSLDRRPGAHRQGRVVAAVNVSSHVSRITKGQARRLFLPPLLKAAHAIESDLGRT
jgi:hypothetical protein